MFNKNQRISKRVWYTVHQENEDGTVEPGYLASEGYSKYYQNNLRYNLGDAREHAQEAHARGGQKWVVVENTEISEVIE